MLGRPAPCESPRGVVAECDPQPGGWRHMARNRRWVDLKDWGRGGEGAFCSFGQPKAPAQPDE